MPHSSFFFIKSTEYLIYLNIMDKTVVFIIKALVRFYILQNQAIEKLAHINDRTANSVLSQLPSIK